jgi:hypothetical protein
MSQCEMVCPIVEPFNGKPDPGTGQCIAGKAEFNPLTAGVIRGRLNLLQYARLRDGDEGASRQVNHSPPN